MILWFINVDFQPQIFRNGREIFSDGIHGAVSAVPTSVWVFSNLRLGEWQGGGEAPCPREQKTGIFFLMLWFLNFYFLECAEKVQCFPSLGLPNLSEMLLEGSFPVRKQWWEQGNCSWAECAHRQNGLEPVPSACCQPEPETLNSIPSWKKPSLCSERERLAAL